MTYENLDKLLTNALIGNGRASLRSLGEDLDVSVTTISNHLEDLRNEGAIGGFTPVINYEAFGYDVTAVLQLEVDGTDLEGVVERLAEHDNFIDIYEVTGDFDVVAIGKYRNTDHMNDTIKNVLSDAAINDSNTSVVLNEAVENHQFDLPVEDDE